MSIPSRVITKIEQMTVVSKVEGDANSPNDAESYWANHKEDLRRCVYDCTLVTFEKSVGLAVPHGFPGCFWALCKSTGRKGEFAVANRGLVPGTFCWVAFFD